MEAKKPGNEEEDFIFDERLIFHHKKLHHKTNIYRTYISRQKDLLHRHKYKKSLGFLTWRKLYFVYLEDNNLESDERDKRHIPKKLLNEVQKRNEILKIIGIIR